MKTALLLPNAFKRIGWIILIPATIAGIMITLTGYESEWLTIRVPALFYDDFTLFSDHSSMVQGPFKLITIDVTNTLVGVLFIVGGLLVAFSKEKQEDEFIAGLRLSSLLWSVWANYIFLLAGFLLIYGISFLHIMIYNMFTTLIIFIIRFNYILYKNAKQVRYAE